MDVGLFGKVKMGDEATAIGQKAQLVQMEKMLGILSQTHLGGMVPMFGGQKEIVQPWIWGLEKYVVVTPGSKIILTAYLRSHGAASDMIADWIKANDKGTWEELKKVIIANFAGAPDKSRVWKKLKETRQLEGEKVKIVGARLVNLAKEFWTQSWGRVS